jgi:hypothetical protein
VNLFRTEEAADVQNWIFVSGGADFIVGARPHNRLSIQLRYAPMLFNADLSNSGGAKLSLMHRLVGGVEFGF